MVGISLLSGIIRGPSDKSSAPPASSTPSPSSASTGTPNNQHNWYPSTPTQYNGQHQSLRRAAVDDDKRVDLFGEPHLSHGLSVILLTVVITTAGPSEANSRSISDDKR
jgi:hypothetical protein